MDDVKVNRSQAVNVALIARLPTKGTQVTSSMSTTIGIQAAHYWQQTTHYAAKRRLARRYQDEHDRLDVEFNNLRTSQSWLATQTSQESAHLLIAYVKVLASYLRQRGLAAELLQWCEDGLWAGERLREKVAWLLLLRSEARSMLGQWDQAKADIHAAIERSKALEPGTYARAIFALRYLQVNQGAYQTALKTLAVAERLLSAQSDIEGLLAVRMEIAAYHFNQGHWDQALSLYLEAEHFRQQANISQAIDHTQLMLGVAYRKKRDDEKAIEYLQCLLKRSEQSGNRGMIATATYHLAWLYLNQAELNQARRACGRAIVLYKEIGDRRGASDAYEQLGVIELAEGHSQQALPHQLFPKLLKSFF